MQKQQFLGLIILLGLCLNLNACQQNNECETPQKIAQIPLKLPIIPLEEALFKEKTQEGIKKIWQKHPELTRLLLKTSKLSNDDQLAEQFFRLQNAKGIDELYKDCQEKFSDLDLKQLATDFETAFKHIKYYYPNFKVPKIYTLVTGFGYDLVVTDEVILIGKEYFLGEKAKFPLPPQIPAYQMRRYKPAYIVANALQFISQKYNKIDEKDRTLLAEMLYFGKSYYFTKKMLPCLPDSILLGYTKTELANIYDEDNRKYIWGHFVEQKLLFSTNHFHIKSYIEERPYVAEINAKCPGRIGRWLGLRIVEKYANKQNISLPELMREAQAKHIFTQASYKGD